MKKRVQTVWRVLGTVCIVFLIYGFSASPSENDRTIIQIRRTSEGVVFSLDDGQRYLIGFRRESYNKTNVMLFYEGKRVWLGKQDKDGCFHIEPIKQDSMPVLSDEQYGLLIKAEFSDSDIQYSFRIPTGRKNPNTSPPTYGGVLSYGAPGVCAEKLPR
jgi:hypothetical protein